MGKKGGHKMSMSGPDDQVLERFTYRAPNQEQINKMTRIRNAFRETAQVILNNVPQSADRTLALRWLHQANMEVNVAVMFGNQ